MDSLNRTAIDGRHVVNTLTAPLFQIYLNRATEFVAYNIAISIASDILDPLILTLDSTPVVSDEFIYEQHTIRFDINEMAKTIGDLYYERLFMPLRYYIAETRHQECNKDSDVYNELYEKCRCSTPCIFSDFEPENILRFIKGLRQSLYDKLNTVHFGTYLVEIPEDPELIEASDLKYIQIVLKLRYKKENYNK